MRKNKHQDTTLTGGWSQALLKPFFENLRPARSNTYRTVYRFRIDGLVQRVNEDSYELKGFRETEIERKAYGGKHIEMQNSDLILPVLVTFCVRRKDEEFPSALGKTVDGIYVNPYYIGWLHFNEYYADHSSRVPFLDFVIWLHPEEWEAVRESLLIAKVPPVMSVQVEFPFKPDPDIMLPERVDQGLYVLHFSVRGVLAFNETLFENPVLKFDWDL